MRGTHNTLRLYAELSPPTDVLCLFSVLLCYRLKAEQQHCMSVSGSISKEQEGWEERWKSFLGLCPFDLALAQDPVSSFQFI